MSNYIKDEGIVVGTFDYKDKDKVINIFTVNHGIITATLKSVKSSKSKYKSATSIFAFGEFVIVKAKGFDIVKSVEIYNTFYELTRNIEKYYSANILVEVVKKTLMPEEPSPVVFINLLKALNILINSKVDELLILNKFFNGLLKISGYKMQYDNCGVCGEGLINKYYLNNLAQNNVCCKKCKTPGSLVLDIDSVNLLKALDKTDTKDLSRLGAFTGETFKNVFKMLLQRIEEIFGIQLKSKKILLKEIL